MDYTGAEVQVYVDVMLATNFAMDFLILWAVGRLANCSTRIWRLILGALLGAVYSLAVFFPFGTVIHSLPLKIGCSLLMVLLAFYPVRLRAFVSLVLNFYLISFAMGGAVIAATYFLDDAPGVIQVITKLGIFGGKLYYGWLVLGLLVACLIGWGGLTYLRKRMHQREFLHPLRISLKGNLVELMALLDTGNQLREPLTNAPVVVVESNFIKDYLPAYLWRAVREEGAIITELASEIEAGWVERLRLIPYNSVGRNNGIMVGLQPDWIELTTQEGTIRHQNFILGLLNKPLNKEGKYQALIPPEVMEEI